MALERVTKIGRGFFVDFAAKLGRM